MWYPGIKTLPEDNSKPAGGPSPIQVHEGKVTFYTKIGCCQVYPESSL